MQIRKKRAMPASLWLLRLARRRYIRGRRAINQGKYDGSRQNPASYLDEHLAPANQPMSVIWRLRGEMASPLFRHGSAALISTHSWIIYFGSILLSNFVPRADAPLRSSPSKSSLNGRLAYCLVITLLYRLKGYRHGNWNREVL
jgi:hypothetical protein